ncbi:MAG TPA: hypothetical protein VMJ74_14640 [Pseudomonadales bacterium]|nr:hypothetical protein [Pseudomonadales bacterium]
MTSIRQRRPLAAIARLALPALVYVLAGCVQAVSQPPYVDTSKTKDATCQTTQGQTPSKDCTKSPQ